MLHFNVGFFVYGLFCVLCSLFCRLLHYNVSSMGKFLIACLTPASLLSVPLRTVDGDFSTK